MSEILRKRRNEKIMKIITSHLEAVTKYCRECQAMTVHRGDECLRCSTPTTDDRGEAI